ncbi:LPXTG-domain-containing protein cell wall anchor domain [Enterococcus moraviensis ATCC BAA-383]|uniref:LPXTG-domain-containing protein cell wall anchor domain n=1 Tax=Enterococcus moraviensis ATCC BAA-383 TaxID=1158609 RepID=R2U1X1_9ENTE|nr:LPXTG cell wall anchor domain-containing protein [Enterococcus moraviensis]EOI06682.1 LPXTG-domain-containing protein cell wall anchor domain [Enterococcus moraviensis ATCC BAA-383]EOT65019.1 hypothetical protein I586_02753 [Enterococcus moraviensis ATCC BAA-383]OJG66865.1 LPXTG-domain-containing protein cell wall anchor domain [Enterococcus moraviensis]
MKKIVFCLVTLLFTLPSTSFAEEINATSESPTVESSSTVDSTQNTEDVYTKTVDSSFSQISEATSTDMTSMSEAEYNSFKTSTLVVLQGEQVTAEMLQNNFSAQGDTFKDLQLLEEAPTEQLGYNKVKVSFTDDSTKEKMTMGMGYLVAKATPSYDIQFISYDTDKKEVKGRIIAIDDSTPNGIYIYGTEGQAINSIKDLFPLVSPTAYSTTDEEGYFTLPYKDNFSFAAYSFLSGAYSPVYTLTDKAFATAVTTDSSKPVEQTKVTSETKEEKKKGLFPNTGEKKNVYFSIGGIAIILLAILFLFIKSKKK